ncbi:MAG: molybdopterin-dependent oxidoreductase [Thermodesulfobacteriota bacterium]
MTENTVHHRICPLCEAGCGLEITMAGNRVEKIRGDKENPMSRGFCCPKGIALKDLHEDPDRLRSPMIRENGRFRQAGWTEALSLVAEKLSAIRDKHGNDAVGVYLGNPNTHTMAGGLFIRPLIKALKTKNFYTASTVDQMPKMAACGFLYGSPARIPVPDIDRTDLFVVFGANPLVSNGSLMTAPDMPGRIRALQKRGGKMVVIDPLKTRTAKAADQHLFIRPGTDVYMLLAIVYVLFEEDLVSPGHLTDYIDDFDALRQAVAPFSPKAAATLCGIAADDIADLARKIAAAEKCAVYGRMGTSTVHRGTTASWLIEAINILTGNLDCPGGTGFARPAHVADGSIPKKGFAIGRWDSRVSNAAEVAGELPVSVMAEEMETQGDGQIRAFLTVAGNPVVAVPESDRVDAALADLEFMVSVDYYINETTRRADVILPPASILCHGHYDFFFHGLSVRNFACYSPPVLEKDAHEKDKWEILAHLAQIAAGKGPQASPEAIEEKMVNDLADGVIKAMGGEEKSGITREALINPLCGRKGPERILDFLLRIGPYGDGFGLQPEGLNFEKLSENPHGMDLGPLKSWIRHAVANPDGKIHLFPEALRDDVNALQAEIEAGGAAGHKHLLLIGRRHLRTNNSWMHNIESLAKNNPCTLYVHPDDAEACSLKENGHAAVTSAAGTISAPVEITEAIMPGVVSLPHGWGHDMEGVQMAVARKYPGVNTNRLTPRVFDSNSGTAVLNGIPVTVAPMTSYGLN